MGVGVTEFDARVGIHTSADFLLPQVLLYGSCVVPQLMKGREFIFE